jgi:hypothetical protein
MFVGALDFQMRKNSGYVLRLREPDEVSLAIEEGPNSMTGSATGTPSSKAKLRSLCANTVVDGITSRRPHLHCVMMKKLESKIQVKITIL